MRNLLRHCYRAPRNLIVFLIACYQKTLSPDHGVLRVMFPYGYCRHEPTCSEYGKKIVLERGAIVGLLLTAKRLLGCHPWRAVSEEKWAALARKH